MKTQKRREYQEKEKDQWHKALFKRFQLLFLTITIEASIVYFFIGDDSHF